MSKKAIILFSGGLDSTTCLAIAKSQGFACVTLSFLYGQKHQVEIDHAKEIAKRFGVIEHKILSLPLDQIGGSSLIDARLSIPDHDGLGAIPNTYVPARNTIFLSFALAMAEVVQANHIFIGANDIDYAGYPDCRPEYLSAFEKMAVFATKVGVEGQQIKIIAPLLYKTKAEVIQEGLRLGIDYSKTISCYRANSHGHACGTCDSCAYRKKGFLEVGIPDPTIYY